MKTIDVPFIDNKTKTPPYLIMNHLQRIFEALPNNWEYTYLSQNPNIDAVFAYKYKNDDWDRSDWDWFILSSRASMKDVINNPDIPWRGWGLSKSSKITIDDVKNNPQIDWDYSYLFSNHNIDIDELIYYNRLIDYNSLSRNNSITIDFILNNINKPLNFYDISLNAKITLNDVLGNPQVKWDYIFVYINQNITLEECEVLYNRKLINHWYDISEKITYGDIDFILRHKDKKWDWKLLSSRIDVRDIIQHLDLPWKWDRISENPTLSLKIIVDNPHLPWNWENIGYNPCITIKFILDNKDKNWDWYCVSINPSITADDILTIKDIPWDIDALQYNEFKYSKILIDHHIHKLRIIRKKVKSFKIKKWYKLYLMTKTEAFWKWYCAPGGIGNSIDKKRLQKCIGL